MERFCATIGIVGGVFMKLIGGFDYSIKAMLLLMLIDIVAGFVCAWIFDTSQYSKNGVTSSALIQGAFRKIFMLAIIAMGVVVDNIMGFNYVRNALVIYFIATEGISIIEHFIVMGIPVPAFLKTMLENLQKESETKPEEGGKRLYKGKREI